MRRKDLVTTTMALTLAVFMSAVSTGCGHQSEIDDVPVASESVIETEVVESSYKVVDIDKPYDAMVTKAVKLIEDLETNAESSVSLTKETYVTVTAEVYYQGVLTSYYKVNLEDGSTGFIDGEYLDFNVSPIEDYADSLEEIEGGDGEEVEETTEAPVENTNPYNVTDCDPVTKYTNTNANIRAIPDKSGELINTVSLNTALQVTGTTDNGWSRVENSGVICYIKSSLLSDTKTEVKQPSSGSYSSGSTPSSNQGVETQPQQTVPSTSEQQALQDAINSLGWGDGPSSVSDVPTMGTTGDDGSGGNMNVQ